MIRQAYLAALPELEHIEPEQRVDMPRGRGFEPVTIQPDVMRLTLKIDILGHSAIDVEAIADAAVKICCGRPADDLTAELLAVVREYVRIGDLPVRKAIWRDLDQQARAAIAKATPQRYSR